MTLLRRHPTVERFFCSPTALADACSYAGGRADLDAFRAELIFKFEGPTLVARLYKNEIRLHSDGTGAALLDTGGVFGFTDLAQPIAYLMARFW